MVTDGTEDAVRLGQLRATIRSGLVASVGAERAKALAAQCFEGLSIAD
jgi:hypothetical protein